MIQSGRFIKNLFTIFFLLFVSLVAFHIPSYALLNDPIFQADRSKLFQFSQQDKKIYRAEGMALSNINGIDSLVPYFEDKSSSFYDLYISFDTNFLNNYQVVDMNFQTNYNEVVSGQYSGQFLTDKNTILLLPKRTSIFSKHNRLQSFTLNFDLYPYIINESQQIIAEYFIYDKTANDLRPHGFRISINKGIVQYEFLNFFVDNNGVYHSFSLTERKNLVHNRWEQHTLVVDSQNQTIRIYRNGEEQAVDILTDNRTLSGEKLFSSPLFSTPNLSTPFIIGNNAMISLDNFAIYQGALQDVASQQQQEKSFAETEVFKISPYYSFLNFMEIQNVLKQNPSIRLAYRFQEDYFLPNLSSNNLPWIYINPQMRRFPSSQSEGRYLQWRIEHHPSVFDENNAFSITNIIASYYENTPPARLTIESVKAFDQAIEIQWRNPQTQQIAEFEIYYGDKPQTYFGTANISPNSPIQVAKTDYQDSLSATYRIEGLENDKTYFISVRAKDIYGQYSSYSYEVNAYPSSTENGFGFSVGR